LRGLDISHLALLLPGLVLAFSVHEYAHARVAVSLGDPTPRAQGRLTLDPLAHLDIMGTLLLLFYGFGWAKPVQVNPANLRTPRRDMMLVAAAGPIANIITAFLLGVLLVSGLLRLPGLANVRFLGDIVRWAISINITLAAFNLVPIPPLDGSNVLIGLLPQRQAQAIERVAVYGPLLLFVLVFSGMVRYVLNPFIAAVQGIVLLAVDGVAHLFGM
jgi:Zn-dependent protease